MSVATGRADFRLKLTIFVVMLFVYLAVGHWLQVQHGFIMGDTLSRVVATQSVLFSRDPHLAALGFIFTPVTAMVQIPAVALGSIWPDIAARAFAGTIMSATFMAGAAVQTLSMGTDRGLPRAYSVTLTLLFALNPMIVFYGSNGMSEAPFIFFMTWAVRRLILWMVDDDVHHLVAAGGIAMGLAYLTRYDAAACVAAAGCLVGITTYLRAKPPPRLRRAILDMLIVAGPGFLAFLGWAAAGWLITGEAFAQFTSQYGNTAILEQSGQTAPNLFDGLAFAAICIMLLAPTMLPLALWAVMQRWGRPNWQMLIVPLALFGAVLAFQSYSYASGSTFPFLRFFIIAIPLSVTMAMLGVPDGVFRTPTRRGRYAPEQTAEPVKSRSAAPYIAVAATVAVGIPVTMLGMAQPKYAPQEYGLGAVLNPDPYNVTERKAIEHQIARTFGTEREIAQYLENLHLPDSSVITDTVYGFGILAASSRPRVFVIPSDPDFTELLNDPSANGVRYLLAVPATGRGTSDALNVRYPTLYDTGAEVATLELEIPNDGDGQPDWRLYRVNEPVAKS
ncbi:ABC transporter [Mycolicibacterium conceptionense]|uniref:ArnT family glycosyltransferase n=1 Tax=Mycolicibacterium conceptionense TaxID=451644 RepID=UPI0007ECF5B7|nr:ABC transporter [Mycolicibacterium conceptionense]OBJ96807.1 ABC transporter [Mycolicibacterium conceptionense]OMB77884.1 ABC transporter [Mycolicibacterium conceptionense]OMB78370.1 ABC transporter [Mycolicibacterium conceptionense]